MRRTLLVFAALVALFFGFDFVSRHVLGLGCVGAVLPVWGCVAEPYPTALASYGDLSGSLLVYGGLLLAGLAVAFLLRDLVFTVGGYLLGRYRPDVVERLDGEPARTYRVR